MRKRLMGSKCRWSSVLRLPGLTEVETIPLSPYRLASSFANTTFP